jgi:magnesium chelatase family protein
MAKRAFEVASVGNLPVLLVGPLGAGKTTIRQAFPEVRSDERESCMCGHYLAVTRECNCKADNVTRWHRRMERFARDFDIILEVCHVPNKELMRQAPPDTKEDDCRNDRIARARAFGETHTSIALTDETAFRTMEMASRRMAFTAGQFDKTLRIARAIANLDQSETLKAKHVAEACQYVMYFNTYRRVN